MDAARQLESIDPEEARETYLEVLGAAMWTRGVDGSDGVQATADGARLAPSTGPTSNAQSIWCSTGS